MISPQDREHEEKTRSASAASHVNPKLVLSNEIIARYLAPSEHADFPLEYAFHLLGDVNGKIVLEYGCGDGLNTIVLSARGAKVIGLDISPELLELAKQRLIANQVCGTMLLLGSAHALPLQDESVDVIFGIAILHHLDLEAASREVQRVLKKGGRGIFEEPLRNSKLMTQIRRLFPQRADVSPFERPLTDHEIKDFAQPCQYREKTFQLLLSRLVTLVPFLGAVSSRVCNHIDTILLRLFPSLTYYGSVKIFEITKH